MKLIANILSPITTVIGSVIDIIFGSDKPTTTAPTPTVTPPTPMPTPGDDGARAAKRKSLMDQMARQGRASTILTDQSGTSDKLGS